MTWRKPLTYITVSALTVAAAFFGTELVRDAQFAIAQQQVETSRENLAKVEDLATVFRNVGRAVEPSVVRIEARKMAGRAQRMRQFDFYDDELREWFGDRDGDGEPDLPPGFGDIPVEGTGSGVIVEAVNGTAYIVTNNHVAGDATEMTVTLADGRIIEEVTLVGADAKTDLAVLKIQADRVIPAKWGNSDELDRGDWVLAFGSPFGYIGSMTHGIVSALNRQVGILAQQQGYEDFIQVDAPINPGNSGGPLVNIRGEIIGINTAIATRSGGFQGIGFAIPSNQAKFVYEQIKEKGKVTRGWLGVSIRDVASQRDLAASFGYEESDGVLIHDTFPDTPAYNKLQVGDIVTKYNDVDIRDTHQLRNLVARTPPGTEVTITVFREKKEQAVKLTLGEQPDEFAAASRSGGRGRSGGGDAPSAGSALDSLGLRLEDVNAERARRLGYTSPPEGAMVANVAPNSPAMKAGLRRGVIITKVMDTEVHSAAEARAELEKADINKGVRLYVTTPQGSQLVFLKVGK